VINIIQKNLYENGCFNPLFFENIKEQINEYHPDIVVINTDGELERGTFFHHEFLKTYMKGYYLLDHEKLTGIGDHEALRMSIYVRDDVQDVNTVNLNRRFLVNYDTFTCYNTKNNGKALVKFVKTKYGIMAFMGYQIPKGFNDVEHCYEQMQTNLLHSGKISYSFMMGNVSTTNIEQMEAVEWHNVSHNIETLYFNTVYNDPMTKEHQGIMGVYELVKVNI
jgi:hypothetical protein